ISTIRYGIKGFWEHKKGREGERERVREGGREREREGERGREREREGGRGRERELKCILAGLHWIEKVTTQWYEAQGSPQTESVGLYSVE
ncbi:MAG: hypothetical protein LQ349_007908, partial [Xanthoria aureola]